MSKAHIRASAKYNQEHYRKFQANIKPEDMKIVEEYCEKYGLSKAQFIVRACRYLTDNSVDISKE